MNALRWSIPGVLAVLLPGCGKGAHPEPATARAFSLIYTGNVDGEIEPCG